MTKTTQLQVTKPATKTATKSRAAKPAKSAAKPAQEPVRAAFYLNYRPSAGGTLFAYTLAWLQIEGLIDGGSMDLGRARKLAGGTTIGWHQAKGRFVIGAGTLKLAQGAANFFGDRAHSAAEREQFAEFLTTGKATGVVERFTKGAGNVGKF